MPVYLPKDTQSALGEGLSRCQSVSLILSKFPIFLSSWPQAKRASLGLGIRDGDSDWIDDDARRDEKPGEPEEWVSRKHARDFARKGAAGGRKVDASFPPRYLQSQVGYRLSLPGAVHLVRRLEAPLALDLATGCLENAGLKLHPFSSLPIIPGSAVKGCARAAAIAQLKQATDDGSATRQDLLNEILQVFGWAKDDLEQRDSDLVWAWHGVIHTPAAKANSGKVAFLSGLPTRLATLKIDVLACHHPEYYTKNRDKAEDDEQPNVQVFPVVDAGTEFLFTLVPLAGASDSTLRAAARFLEQALEVWGLGAKTAAGYGFFKTDGRRLDELRADLQRETGSSGPSPEERGVVATPAKSYRQILEESDHQAILQQFANRTKLEPDQQRELADYIQTKGVEQVLNPARNQKGLRRVQEFSAWQAALQERRDS